MIKLEHDKFSQVYEIPTTLKEMSLTEWIRYKGVEQEEIPEGSFDEEILMRNAFKMLINGFEIPEEELKHVETSVLVEVVALFKRMLFDEVAILKSITAEDYEQPEFLEVDGVKYYLPENLHSRPYGQWVDCHTYMAKFKDEFEFYPLNMAVWMLKEGEEYGYGAEGDDIVRIQDERQVMFSTVSVQDALEVNSFFLLNSQRYTNAYHLCFPQAESLLLHTRDQTQSGLLTDMGGLPTLLEQLKINPS